MIKTLFRTILAAMLFFSATIAIAAAPNSTSIEPSIIPSPPDISAQAYVLMDADTGKILASKNMDQKRPPASLTKMMTLYLISKAIATGTIGINDPVRISKDAWQMGGSKMFVRVGTRVSVKELIQGIIVDSGNDACVAMAEYVAGSQEVFTNMMNAEAKLLKMTNTHYIDCTGLPHPDHYSTAHDLALLARAIIENFPQDYQWYSQKWFAYNNIRQPNRNRLLWRFKGADGLKTGHTAEAGFCLVSSAKRDGMRLISVVMGAPTDEARARDSIQLLTYGFRFFQSHQLFANHSVLAHPRIWYGEQKTIPAGVDKDLTMILPRGSFSSIKVTFNLKNDIRAPIKAGETLGQLNIILGSKTIATKPVVALQSDATGGIWRHIIDWIAHLFHNWFGHKTTSPIILSLPQSQ